MRIECEDCKPLQVRFYDEMPEVEITLSAGGPQIEMPAWG